MNPRSGGSVNFLHLYDPRNHLFLTGIYLPAVFPTAPAVNDYLGVGRNGNPVPDDESIGRMLTVMAKQRAASRLRGTGRDCDDAGLQTWVLDSSPLGMGQLEDWFRGARPTGRYRVLIHRTPCQYAGRALPVLWDEVYDEACAMGASAIRGYSASSRALRSGVTALEEGLGAYPRGGEAVMTWAEGLGHPYTLVV